MPCGYSSWWCLHWWCFAMESLPVKKRISPGNSATPIASIRLRSDVGSSRAFRKFVTSSQRVFQHENYDIGSNRDMESQGLLARRSPMPTPFAPRLILSQNLQTNLQTLAHAHSTPQALALRARIVLRAADADTPNNVQ